MIENILNVEVAFLQLFSDTKDIIKGLFRRFVVQFWLKIIVLKIFGCSQLCASRIEQL